MQHIVPWYRPEDYPLIRKIMDDGAKMPDTFEGWKIAAERQISESNGLGVDIKTLILDPEEFVAFCDERKLPRGSFERTKFVEWLLAGENHN
jgi:hypothetical protein